MALFSLFRWDWLKGSLFAVLVYWFDWRNWMRDEQIYNVDTLRTASESGIDCESDPFLVKYRTITGICNDFEYPEMGSVDTRFNRNVPPNMSYPENDTLLIPNPRLIARELLWEDSNYDNINPRVTATHLNLFVASWIQFMIHDWVNHGQNILNETIDIPLDADDPWYGRLSDNTLKIHKTRKDPTYGNKDGDEDRPETFLNTVTAWWDASMIYGVTQEINDLVRNDTDRALLKIDAKNKRLIVDPNTGKEITGENLNWWIGLSLLHTLFTLEHNYIVGELRKEYGDKYDEDELYHIARLNVAAMIAKIHTIDWTPAILYDDAIKMGLDNNWFGGFYLEWFLNDKGTYEGFKHPVVDNSDLDKILDYVEVLRETANDPSAARGTRAYFNMETYQFTEAFVSVYRLHPLMPDNLIVNDDTIDIRKTIQNNNTIDMQDTYSTEDLMWAFGRNNHPNALFLNGYSTSMTNLWDEGLNQFIDLATIDILRQRERGVPRYNDFRYAMGLERITGYDELIDVEGNQDLIDKLNAIYPEGVDQVDMLIGMFLENQGGKRVPDGWIFGETQFAVFLSAASNRLKADRFYSRDCLNEEYYTSVGMDYLNNNAFRSVLLRHFPQFDGYIPSNGFLTFYSQETDELGIYNVKPNSINYFVFHTNYITIFIVSILTSVGSIYLLNYKLFNNK